MPSLYVLVALLASASLAGAWGVGFWAGSAKFREQRVVLQAEAARQAKTMDRLREELSALQARKVKERVVFKEVVREVKPDLDCRSLPPSFRLLWNASPGDQAEAGAGGPAPVPGLAETGGGRPSGPDGRGERSGGGQGQLP